MANPHSLALSVPDEVLVVRLQPNPFGAEPAGAAIIGAPAPCKRRQADRRFTCAGLPATVAPPRAYAVYRMGALVGQTATAEFRDCQPDARRRLSVSGARHRPVQARLAAGDPGREDDERLSRCRGYGGHADAAPARNRATRSPSRPPSKISARLPRPPVSCMASPSLWTASSSAGRTGSRGRLPPAIARR